MNNKPQARFSPALSLSSTVMIMVSAMFPVFIACSSKPCCGGYSFQFQLPARPEKSKDVSVEMPVYKISAKPFSREDAKQFIGTFGVVRSQEMEIGKGNFQYRSAGGDSGIINYFGPSSELSYYRRNTPTWGRDGKPLDDRMIRMKTDSLLKKVLGERAKDFSFTNVEKSRMSTIEDTTLRDEYYFGRYVMKLNNRHVLGGDFQVRAGFGANDMPAFFSFRDPARTQSGVENVPTRGAVWDSLSRWKKSRNKPVCLRFSSHPDMPYITDLAVTQIINTYVEITAPPNGDSAPAKVLVPRVTVVATARLKRPREPEKNQTTFPLQDPLVMYFHFPCTPSLGFCWPDGENEVFLPGVPGRAFPPPPKASLPPPR
ncbi:MAG: hypothetical protein JWO30_1761 [Fibrobacteres bacterium]|nr:hypothetical protein [Fibrobacterota bacterium]